MNPDTLTGLLVPTFLGTATLAGFVSVRNASISDRMRSANKEIFDKNTDPRRKASLRRQIELFRNRYLSNTRALQSSVLANALAFVLVICSAFELYALAAEVLRFLGVVLAITVGFVFAEIFRSHQTLDEDVQAAIASIDEPRSSADPPSPGD